MTPVTSLRDRLTRVATHPTLTALVVLSALWALFFWRLLTPNPADRVIFDQRGDFIFHFYAPISYQIERFWAGELALWNPYNNAGEPLAANIQYGMWYPLRYLVAILSGPGNWSIETYQLEIAAHYWLASVLMYAFLRVVFRRPALALVGSILFAYSGYATGYPLIQGSTIETEAWLPLVLMGAHLSVTQDRWGVWGGCLGGLGIGLALLAGRPQSALYVIYLAVLYLLYLGFTRRLKPLSILWRIALLCGVGAGLAAVQLLPMWEYTELSYRVIEKSFDDKMGGFAGSELVRLILPGLAHSWSPLYLGVAGLVLAAGALLRSGRDRVFWAGALIAALFLSLGGTSILYDVLYLAAPGFSLFRNQERAVSLVVFALVMLAMHQLDRLLDGGDSPAASREDRRFSYVVYGYAGLMALAFAVAALTHLQELNTSGTEVANTLGPVALIALLAAAWYRWRASYAGQRWHIVIPLVALIVLDLFPVGMRSINYLPDTPENRLQLPAALEPYVSAPEQIEWRVDGAAGLRGSNVHFRIPDIYGTGPIWLASIEALRATVPVDRFWEVLAVRYVTMSDEPPPEADVRLVAYGTSYDGQEFKVFELEDPRPLAYLVYDYRDASGSAEFARQIMADTRVDLREMAVTLAPLPLELPVERPALSRVDDFRTISPQVLEMTVSTGANALLTIAIPNYPGWRAYVNGAQVEVVDTYAGLMGIPLHAGENQTVQLEFAPASLHLGGALSAATLAAAAILCVGAGLRRRRAQPAAGCG